MTRSLPILGVIVALAGAVFLLHASLPRRLNPLQPRSVGQPSSDVNVVPSTTVNHTSLFNDVASSCRRLQLSTGESFVVAEPTAASSSTGIFLLFHGCSHSAHDFCFQDAQCPKCRALPEEVRWVSEGLKRQFTVVAVSSSDRRTGCWDTRRNDINVDVRLVSNVLAHLKLTPTRQMRLLAMGASSGGVFSARFIGVAAERWGVETVFGAIAQVASPPAPKLLREAANARFVWSVMARDTPTAKHAELAAKAIKDPSRKCVVRHHKLPLFDDHFVQKAVSERAMTSAASKALVKALRDNGFLDRDSFLLKDPRHSDWRRVARPVMEKHSLDDLLKADKSPVSESLNVAFAQHEFTSEHASAMIDFVTSQGACPSS